MNILIVDEHTIFSSGLRLLLMQLFPESHVDIKRFSSLRDFISNDWDIILLDIDIQEKSSIEILKYVKKENPTQSILMLGSQHEDHYAIRALKAGAQGYLPKGDAPTDLEKAISMLMGGYKYISPRLAQLLAEQIQNNVIQDRAPHDGLSDREFDVFMHLAAGKTVSDIAELMLLSVKTVSTYRSRILSKMQLKNNADVVQYAMKYHLLSSKQVVSH